jgi:hypothetical protein
VKQSVADNAAVKTHFMSCMTKIASVLFGNADSGLAREYFCTFEDDSPQRTHRAQSKTKEIQWDTSQTLTAMPKERLAWA